MGWETRKGGRYYYRKVWKGGRCRSKYVGSGESAELVAQLDAIERERRASTYQVEPDPLADFDRQYLALEAQIRGHVAEVLTAAGFHQHKREWRKRRVRIEPHTDA